MPSLCRSKSNHALSAHVWNVGQRAYLFIRGTTLPRIASAHAKLAGYCSEQGIHDVVSPLPVHPPTTICYLMPTSSVHSLDPKDGGTPSDDDDTGQSPKSSSYPGTLPSRPPPAVHLSPSLNAPPPPPPAPGNPPRPLPPPLPPPEE